jgi:hypothetical protein
MIQDQYKRLMGADKPFKYFRVLEILKNSPKWLEHSAQLSLKSREQAVTGKTRMQLMGQSKMKVRRSHSNSTCLVSVQISKLWSPFFLLESRRI